MTLELHLTFKNSLSFVVGICVVGLALVPLLVPADHLGWVRWWIAIIGLAVVGVSAILVQVLIQSREDHERDTREKARDTKLDELTGIVKKLASMDSDTPSAGVLPTALAPPATENITPQAPDIDGEVYRSALNPRSMSWQLVRDVYRVQGRLQDAKIDCDILLEVYLVNMSKTESKYIRDLRLSAQSTDGTINLQRQDDLRGPDFDGKKFEYCLKHKQFDAREPLRQLFSALPFCLSPGQPVEGWVRFMAKDVNPDHIENKSLRLTIIDSQNIEHSITKAGERERKGEIALCRLLPSS